MDNNEEIMELSAEDLEKIVRQKTKGARHQGRRQHPRAAR